jgi:site-specific recombinase XerD
MNDLIEQFLEALQASDRAASTVTAYRNDLTLFARWFEQTNGQAFTLESITPTDIRDFRQHGLLVERRKAATVNRRLAALSALFTWAQKTGRINYNPAAEINQVETEPLAPRFLDRLEQNRLERAIEAENQLAFDLPVRSVTRKRDGALVLFLMHTGLRLSEALELRLDDLTLGERSGSVLIRHAKRTRQRRIPLNDAVRKVLQAWLGVRPQNSSDRLWLATEGQEHTSLSSRTVQRMFKRLAHQANIDPSFLTPHVMRHTFARNLIDCGESIHVVARLLGHGSLDTTKRYIQPSERDLEKAVQRLAER